MSRESKLGAPGAAVTSYMSNESLVFMRTGNLEDCLTAAGCECARTLLGDLTESRVAGVSP